MQLWLQVTASKAAMHPHTVYTAYSGKVTWLVNGFAAGMVSIYIEC